MKDPLKGFAIATTGDFGKQRTSEQIKRWVEANGGRYVTKIDENVTHLICSAEHWKSQSSMVQTAKRYPKKVKIVTYDWLEDSLMTKSRKREENYLIKKHVKAAEKKKNAAKGKERSALKKEVGRFNRGCEAALTDVNSGMSKKKPTFADSSLALLKKHEEDFKANKYASKPSVEDYSNYYKPPTEGNGEAVENGEDIKSKDTNANETDTSSDSDAPESSPASEAKSKSQPPESFKPPEPVAKPVMPKTNAPLPEPANHHLYVDPEGYTYNITLVRIKVETNTNERYILRLYQSHTVPYTYALYQRYVKFKAVPEERVLVPVGSSWEQCYTELKNVVKEYTNIEWEQRGVEIPADSRDRTKFVFVKPRFGGPKGMGARKAVV